VKFKDTATVDAREFADGMISEVEEHEDDQAPNPMVVHEPEEVLEGLKEPLPTILHGGT
jgi:hypothetical protein